jgi:5-methylcytosine-specific restriction endonuclease McrA
MDKKAFKHAAGKCRICGETNYVTLQAHRINAGEYGGKYSKENCVSLCANCHTKIHAKQMIIDRYYTSSSGKKLRIVENGEERFI